MVITILLLAILFIASLINIIFYFPTKKIQAWLQSFLPQNSKTISTSTSQVPHKEKSGHKKAELKRVFSTFDRNNDGFITTQELIESLKNIRIFMTDKEVEEMVVKLDANGDGLIDLDEFSELFGTLVGKEGGGSGKEGEEEEDGEMGLKEAFDVFDKDKDGLISVEELGLVLSSLGLNEGKKMEDCKEMIRKVDKDGDGMVNFDEFKKMMKRGGGLFGA